MTILSLSWLYPKCRPIADFLETLETRADALPGGTIASFITFTSLMALLAFAATLALAAVAALRNLSDATRGAWNWIRTVASEVGLWTAAAVAAASTAGSLLYSEWLDFEPCRLCWYQRIAMYPLVVILAIAAWRRDKGVWRYALPLAAIGAGISGYHYGLQQGWFPDAGTCSTSVPCSAAFVWKYDFVSIPFMALAGFLLIGVILLIVRTTEESEE